MKKYLKFICAILISLLLFPTLASAATGTKINYDGKTFTYKDKLLKASLNGTNIDIAKTPGILIDGYAMLPYKEVFANSKIHAETSYSSTKGTIKLIYKDTTILMTIGKKSAYVNGVQKTLSVAPKKVTYTSSGKSTILVPSRFVAENFGLTYKWNSSTSTVEITKKGIDLKYDSKWYSYTGTKSATTVNGTKVSTDMPGIVIDKTSLVPANSVFKAAGATYSYSSDTKTLTLKRYRNTVKMTMGSNIAYVNGEEKTMSTNARLVYFNENSSWYVMVPVGFVAKNLGLNYNWDSTNKVCGITEPESFGSIASITNSSGEELKAMWISYLEFGTTAKTKEEFETMVDTMFDNSVNYGMNAVVVQVRPFADALYPSSYFPWSAYVSGEQGKAVDYDPLEYMVNAAHERGLEFHAWVNPYRVTLGSTDYNSLAEDNIARIWHESDDTKRYVLTYNSNLYFNPAISNVRTLIVNGVKELVSKYDIDGIHMDDYFYPTFSSSNVNTAFDAEEYKAYVKDNETNGVQSLSIADWRRKNVDTLVKRIYTEIKNIDPGVAFGISPAGNLSNLRSSLQHYVDIDAWVTGGYIDYICPQIYWGFDNGTYSYDKVLTSWDDLNVDHNIKLYAGLAVYKAGTNTTTEWQNNDDILKRQIEYARDNDKSDGFMFFRYESFLKSYTQDEIENMLPLLQE